MKRICLYISLRSRYQVAFVKICLAAVDVEGSLLALLHRHVVSSVRADVVLARSDDFVFGVVQKFIPVGQPACHSGNHEEHWEHVSGETHSFIDDSTVEIYVGVKLPLNEVGVAQSYSLQLNCNFYEFFLACNSKHLVSYFLYYFGARVVVFVDSMAETIKQTFFLLNAFDEFGDILLFADRLKHSQYSLIGSSVFRPIESTSGTCNSCVDIDTRGGKMSDCSSGAVEFMLGMQNEEYFQSVHQFGMRLEIGLVEFVEHIEETFDIGCIFGRIVVLSANSMAEGIGGDGGHSAQQTIDLLVSDGFVLVDGLAYQTGVLFGVQSGEGGDSAADDAHGVGIIPEGVHHRQDVLVHESVVHDLLGEGGELFLGGQFSPDDEVGHLQEGALLCEHFDGVSSVFQDASVSIDVADFGCTGDGVHVAGVIAAQHFPLMAEFGKISRFQETPISIQLVSFPRS